MKDILLAQGLKKEFQRGHCKQEVLRNINLTVKAGEYISILGRSHSGKSTLTMIFSGQEELTEGELAIAGVKLNQLSRAELKRFRDKNIGIVYDTLVNQNGNLTALESVLKSMLMAEKRKDANRAVELLRNVGLNGPLDTIVNRMLAIDRQRVAIAAQLAKQPVLFLADEPTNYCHDEVCSNQILSVIESFQVINNMAVILFTQVKNEALRTGKIFRLQAGLLV